MTGRATILVFLVAVLCAPTVRAQDPSDNTKTATVFIANYDYKDDFAGWGSGFFVDEGIVVTNKHVIEGGRNYRIFATGADDAVDLDCYKDVGRSDVKINLDDDAAYIRVFLNCPHGVVHFADSDPELGEDVGVIGYPAQGTLGESLNLTYTTGTVSGETTGPWLRTSAYIHFGNSGGPVVHNGRVVGVAVAKSIDEFGNYISGLFVPISIVKKGLSYANVSTFGYTPQEQQDNPAYDEPEEVSTDPFNPSIPNNKIASNGDCFRSLGEGGEATGYGGCQCKASYHKDPTGTICLPGGEGWTDPYYTVSDRPTRTRRAPISSSSSSSAQRVRTKFSDVEEGSPSSEEINALVSVGILSGYPDGTFRPRNSINRAELTKILVSGLHSEEAKGETNCFPDVKDEWFSTYVCAAERLGWIKGYADGTFRPDQTINRAEALKIIISSLASDFGDDEYLPFDVPEDSWFAPFVSKALQLGVLVNRGQFNPSHELLRKDAAMWIYNGIAK